MNKRTPTKQKILNILKRDSSCSVKEIMEYFNISEIAVRKHINELEQKGFINKITIKQEIGRPYYVYELTNKGHQTFPNQYEKLPLELLQDLEELHGKKAVQDLLTKRMKREESFLKKEVQSDNFDQKIADIARIQDAKGYMVEYGKQADGSYEIKNFNCPIINISSSYRQICSNEKKILENLFSDSDVIARTCITTGDHFCNWTITKPKVDHE